MTFADLNLARRLESTDAAAGVATAAADARQRPQLGAISMPIAGGHAMFVGKDSPVTQAFGMGLHGAVSDAEMDQFEEFFRSRGSSVFIEVCPLADFSLTAHLDRRGYRVLEFSNVLFRDASAEGLPSPRSGAQIQRAASADAGLWSRVVAEGFLGPDYPVEMLSLFEWLFRSEAGSGYLARVDGVAIGGGGTLIHEGVATFFGDSTIAAHRGRGVQLDLIAARLKDAVANGCDLVMATTQCGSISQRNYERLGFRVAYTRTKWQLDF